MPIYNPIVTGGGGGLAIFGDGSDGDVTISGNTTLTRDMFYNNLTVNGGIVLTTAGYRIFVKQVLTNNGIISRNGNNAVGVTGGVALAVGSLGHGSKGASAGLFGGGGGSGAGVLLVVAKTIDNSSGIISANGGIGGDATANPTSSQGGIAGDALTSALGGNGGIGGVGGANGGGAGGKTTIPIATAGGWRSIPMIITLRWVTSTPTSALVSGGGGGGSGGFEDGVGAGGGAGGGGGLAILIYNTLTSGTETTNGGTGGSKYGTGAAGGNGVAGEVIKIPNI